MPPESVRSSVVTGGARGIGRAIAEQLALAGPVVVLEADPTAAAALPTHLVAVVGDAADPAVVHRAADAAERLAPLGGWVNNAAVFADVTLHREPEQVLPLITRNLAPAVVGSAEAVRRFLAHDGGALVHISSHQARRPVRGALAYATAKAAIDGLSRAIAVDYGPAGVRSNVVALGSFETERSREHMRGLGAEGAAFTAGVGRVQPLGRLGVPEEAAATVAFLLSDAASFITGATLPVDGGRSAYGPDPEERDVV